MTEGIQLETLVKYFEDAEDASRDARKISERCRDYYDNVQLTAQEIATLNKRKQPPVVLNLIASQVDSMLGIERQSRTDPKAFPRTPDSEEGAEAVTDAIRYALDNNDFDLVASDVYDNMNVEGTGGASVEVKRKRDEIEIVIPQIPWDRQFSDPYSRKRDHSDARYTGVISWKDLDEVKERWPDAAEMLDAGMEAAVGDTYDDKPQHWWNKQRKRVMCVDMYFKYRRQWHHAIFANNTFLDEPAPSAYLDEDGLPENPQHLVSAKVKRDGQRYGPVEALLDPQDEVNKRRSKSLHASTTRQTFGKKGMIDNVSTFKAEANKPDGHLEFPNHGEFGKDFGVMPPTGLDVAQFNLYLDAKDYIQTVRQSEALQGKSENLSGVAIGRLQQGGMTEQAPVRDTHAHFKKAIYRAVWNRIKQFWTDEKWVRVTDDEGSVRFTGLNQPITRGEQMLVDETGASLKDIREQFGQKLEQAYEVQPQLKEPVAKENNVVEMDVDIIVEDVPDTINQQAEDFDIIAKLYQANPEGIPWEDVVQLSTLRNKDKILKKDLSPEEKQAAEQASAKQDEILKLEKADKTSEIQDRRAGTALKIAQTEGQQIENQLAPTQANQ